PNCALFDVDDLGAAVRGTAIADEPELARAEAIVVEEGERFARWQASRAAVPAIRLLRGRAESIRRAALDRHRGELADLSPRERRAGETLTTQLVAALTHEPTVELRRAAEAA